MNGCVHKFCPHCKQYKPLTEFRKYRAGICRPCANQKQYEWFKKNPDKKRKNEKNYWDKHHEHVTVKRRNATRKRIYNLSPEAYNKLYEQQRGCCAICGIHSSKLGRILQVDHDHLTNKVRGLLCWGCNVAAGLFYDEPELLQKACDYLERFQCKNI
jgi:hypothetical protein